MLELRSVTPDDYPAFAALLVAAQPEWPVTADDLRRFASEAGPADVSGWFLALENGETVGAVRFDTPRMRPVPGEFDVRVAAPPERRGLEGALYERLLGELAPLGPRVLRARVREDSHLYPFYLERGFSETERMWQSTLDLETFDPAPFAWAPERSAAGVAVRTLAQLRGGEDWERRHYALMIELLSDVPWGEPFIPWPFELWRERLYVNERLLPEGYFFAVAGEELVGVSELWGSSRPGTLHTGLTGVRSAWRRRGVAQTLKLRAAAYAREQGYRFLSTSNHTGNRPMLSINEAMGFAKEPATVSLRKELP